MSAFRRNSIRLPNYDYTTPGAYFVTICAFRKWRIFGEIVDGKMNLNEWGTIVRDEWIKTGQLRSNITLDEYVVMPNHWHGIIRIDACRGTARCAPTATARQFGSMDADSIPSIIRAFKSAVTCRINALRKTPCVPVWQRNYYEHIIRNERELTKCRQYILDNPLDPDAHFPHGPVEIFSDALGQN
jgi:putative transposase